MAAANWKADLNSLFNPRSIAIIGASEGLASFTNVAYQHLKQFGYEGSIFPVNPKRDDVWGIPAFKTVRDIEGQIDQVIIAISARMVPAILKECGVKGVGSAVVFSSGFSEMCNEEGIGLQKEIAAVAEEYKIRLCGPNCVGVASIKNNTVCYSAPLPPEIPRGKVAYVSQSATMAANIVSAGVDNGIGFAYAVSSGNEAVLEVSDYMQFMLQDPEVEIVAAYVESFKDARKFHETADYAVGLGKPILVIKLGKSEKGKKAAASHTGALTGSHAVYQAAFKQKGIISVTSNEEMIETIKVFSHRKPLNTGGLAIISGSGGACVYLADRSEEVGLSIPDFGPTTEARIRKALPEYGTVHNPLDTTGQARTDLEITSEICRAILEDDQIDILMMALGLTRSVTIPFIQPVLRTYIETAREYPDKLAGIISSNTESFTKGISEFVETHEIPLLQGGGVGLKALKSLVEYSRFLLGKKEPEGETLSSFRPKAGTEWQSALKRFPDGPPEKTAKDLLEEYGIRAPRREVVFTLEDAKETASHIGYPVVLKIHSPKIRHKTELGAVKTGLSNGEELSLAFTDIEKIAARIGSEGGFLLEEMIEPGTELILGMQKDPFFGPVIMLGTGGIFTEIFKDVTFRLPPIAPWQAVDMIQELRASKLLYGFRDRPRADVDALVEAIVRISYLSQDISEVVSEIDLNPLVVLKEGKGVVALDALVIPAT